jgi:LacI family transcriptional regulator
MKERAISQLQIAKNLGVSQAVVSHVLNGKRRHTSSECYERIWQYAIKKGYRPKGMQAAAAHSSAINVGLVLRAGLRPYSRSNYFNHVEHGLHMGLLDHGYYTVFLGSEDDLRTTDLRNKFKPVSFFGVVTLGEIKSDFLKSLKAWQNNVVSIGATYPGQCQSVLPNDPQSMQLLSDHLTGLGHQRFAWIGGNKRLGHNTTRREAFIEKLKAKGVKLQAKDTVETEGGDRLDGWKATETMLQRISPRRYPTAWVCVNGLVARGVINCLMQNGWRVPEQISVVAVDATSVVDEERPQITGAHSDAEEMGRVAAELLLKAGQRPEHNLADIMVSAKLTVRETSAKPPRQKKN